MSRAADSVQKSPIGAFPRAGSRRPCASPDSSPSQPLLWLSARAAAAAHPRQTSPPATCLRSPRPLLENREPRRARGLCQWSAWRHARVVPSLLDEPSRRGGRENLWRSRLSTRLLEVLDWPGRERRGRRRSDGAPLPRRLWGE